MSAAVRSAIRDELPEGVSVTDLGHWRFRGLPEPIEMFQVETADLPSKFPPLRGAERATGRR